MPTEPPLDHHASASADEGHEAFRGEPQFRHEISSDVVLSGRIHFPADARVDGRLKGEVHADQLLLIGQAAEVNARIRAQKLLIEGTLTGDVIESGEVRIAATGSVFGSIQARCLTVEAGARFEGRVRSYAAPHTELLTVEESTSGIEPSEEPPVARKQ